MIRCIHWTVTKGNKFSQTVHSHLKLTNKKFYEILKDNNHPDFPGNSLFTKPIGKLYNWRVTQRLISLLFRYPTLMFLLSIFAFSNPGITETYFVFVSIFWGLWLEALHLLIYRYQFGAIDNVMNAFSVRIVTNDIIFPSPRRVIVRRFILIYLSTFLTVVISYGALYACLANEFIPGNCLTEINFKNPIWIQTTYFSTATICTVGFGDIHVRGYIAQLVCTSEMVMGFVILVLLLTAFSATMNSDKD